MKNYHTMSILGDSISTFEGYIPSKNKVFYPAGNVEKVEDTWWFQVKEALNLKLLVNQSFSGSRVTLSHNKPSSSAFCSTERLSSLKGDIIIIYGGVNDYFRQDDLPTLSFFVESYDYILRTIRTLNPDSKIICLTSGHWIDNNPMYKNSKGISQIDLNDSIVKSADKNSIDSIDILRAIELTPSNFYLGAHPSREGMKQLADYIINRIIEIL